MLQNFIDQLNIDSLLTATGETVYMTVVATIATFLIGLLLGVALYATDRGQLYEMRPLNLLIGAYVNVFRSIPFLIIIILLLPVTKILVGTVIGPNAALPALIIGTAPFYARMVEMALREIPRGVIEASEAMGASRWTIITRVLIPESLPALVSGITVTAVSLVSFTAIAGVIGAGGLGNLAWLEGFQRGNNSMVLAATIVILIIVFVIQTIGDQIIKRVDKR
ncbi:MAG: methionine ABC transporter permease [Bacilli bacterium]